MTIYQALTSQQIEQLSHFLNSDQVAEGCLDFIAMHGFLTGLATGPEPLVDSDWLTFLMDGEPEYQSQQQHEKIEELIHQQLAVIQRSLYLGEELELPCPMTAASPGESNKLSDWCFGFIESIGIDEDSWFDNEELTEAVAELILPVGILSEQFADPELEHITNDKQARQEMADDLIENIQNLFLLFRE